MSPFSRFRNSIAALVLLAGSPVLAQAPSSQIQAIPTVGVAPQYDSTHVYVAPGDVDSFVTCFLGTFGGKSTKQVVATVTPTASSTTSQLLQTPSGTVSLFGFTTPIPTPFGAERTGFLVKDLDAAVAAARSAGAELLVPIFRDAIGRDAIVRFPGGVMTQLYWHTTAPSYPALTSIPENRVYISTDSATAFLHSFLQFSQGKVVSDDSAAAGVEIGRTNYAFRRVEIESAFGKTLVLVTDGVLPFPYGREVTGYEVTDLTETLRKATALGAKVLVQAVPLTGRKSAMVEFPGGYVAEVHTKSSPDETSSPVSSAASKG